MRQLGLLALVAVAVPQSSFAQCPDGTPPPCGPPRVAAPDPNRVAILPFRVSTADSLLGEGIPELLSVEFTGERAPRAAHMGTVLRVWRRAGGALRTPLPQSAQLRVAREVGCGLLIEGSVVGLGSRLSLTASVMTVAGGEPRRVGPISGPADSLELLIGRLASGLLGALGGSRGEGVDPATRLTDSPRAMRAYLEGLARYRRGRSGEAGAAFERALMLDSGFARATLMRYLADTWGAKDPRWAAAAFAVRDRLSPPDRVLLTAYLGERHPAPRSPAQHLADRRRAAAVLPESPEAHAELGEYLFHGGGANMPGHLAAAREAFTRSLALEPQAFTLLHLIEIALYQADTTALTRWWRAYDAVTDDSSRARALGIAVAARIGDSALASAMAFRTAPLSDNYLNLYAANGAVGAVIPRLAGRDPDSWFAEMQVALGRPSVVVRRRAAVSAEGEHASAAGEARGIAYDHALVMSALFEAGDSAEGARAAARLAAATPRDSLVRARAACTAALWQLATGVEARYDAALLRRHALGACAATLALVRARRDSAPDVDHRLEAVDSMLRWTVAAYDNDAMAGFEHRIVARLWEERGERARALHALHYVVFGFADWRFAASDAREEGRLAALLGDTTTAIRAYRRYLDFRRDAEPALIPQRDSVRAELARLLRQ